MPGLSRWVMAGFVPVVLFAVSLSGAERPHVLFLAIDDLRPALGCYGDEKVITPNIDRLANRGTTFLRAYSQEAVCSPSRQSLLTGRRPDTIKVWDLKKHFRETLPKARTLPQYFREHGYHTRSIGKILHGSGPASKDPISWSEQPIYDHVRDAELRYALPKNLEGSGLKRAAVERVDVPDDTYVDGLVCEAALEAIDNLATSGRPFFLAVGFHKPHLPFCAPARDWDLYDRKTFALAPGSPTPEDAPEIALRSWLELEGYYDIPKVGAIDAAKAAELRHGYYACVSYIDRQVGRLIDQIDDLGLADDTVVCLWGDHGFHLGEQGLWTKANNYELATRAPWILSVPGQANPGSPAGGFVEFVDVFPTLAEACELPAPGGVEGISALPLLENPDREWKRAAFSQYPRPREGSRFTGRGEIMGYALRTGRHRYVEWRNLETGAVVARELYDHDTDPGEIKNLAGDPPQAELLRELADVLASGWKGALPES